MYVISYQDHEAENEIYPESIAGFDTMEEALKAACDFICDNCYSYYYEGWLCVRIYDTENNPIYEPIWEQSVGIEA